MGRSRGYQLYRFLGKATAHRRVHRRSRDIYTEVFTTVFRFFFFFLFHFKVVRAVCIIGSIVIVRTYIYTPNE